MARLITSIIDSTDLHRGSFRAGDFSQVRDSADSWKQESKGKEEAAVEGTRGPSGEINTSKMTRPLCLSSCLVIPGGYRTNGLFQVISRAASPYLSREGLSLSRSLPYPRSPDFPRVVISRMHIRTRDVSPSQFFSPSVD